MVDDRSARVRALIAQAARKSTPPSDEAEIYYDLKISGEDFYDLIDRLIEEFRTDFSGMDASQWIPAEGDIRTIATLFGFRL